MDAQVGDSGDQWPVHRPGDVLILETAQKEVEVVDILDLGNHVREMRLEGCRVVVVQNVEIDAMSPAQQEGRAVSAAAPQS